MSPPRLPKFAARPRPKVFPSVCRRYAVQEHHVLDLLGRLSQPTAKGSEKDHTEIGVTLEDRQKIPAVQNQEFALRLRHRVRAPLLAVEHCDSAKDVAGVEGGKNNFVPANGKRADLDAAAHEEAAV